MWVVAAGLAVARKPWLFVGAAALVAINPVVGVLALAGASIAIKARNERPQDSLAEATWLRRLAGEVRAGATLRNAIASSLPDSAHGHVATMCAAGVPIREVGLELADSLPISGQRFAALCSMSEMTGAPVDSALVSCAEAADDSDRRVRRQRTATTQVRLSAWVVGLGPLLLTGVVVALRGVPEPGGALVVVPMVLGVVLEVVGLMIVFRISRRVIA